MRICKHCGSKDVIKNGGVKRWSGGHKYRVQRYLCNNCGHSSFGKKGVPLK